MLTSPALQEPKTHLQADIPIKAMNKQEGAASV